MKNQEKELVKNNGSCITYNTQLAIKGKSQAWVTGSSFDHGVKLGSWGQARVMGFDT